MVSEIDLLYYNNNVKQLAQTIQMFPFITLAGASAVFSKVIDDISSGFTEVLHPDLFTLYQQNYHKAISGVLGDPDLASRYFAQAQKFNLNTAKLAAYKSHYATGLLQKLYKEDPKKFAKYSGTILKTFNRWQATEYNTTVARTRSAKQFIEFEAEKELYPNIEWLATRSSTPRELHASFVGLVLPQNDPFWQENQPGNLYNCKCDWKSTDKKTSDIPMRATTVKPAKGLEGNPASTGELFTENHSYYDKAQKPKDVNQFFVKQVLPDQRIDVREWSKIHLINKTITGVAEIDEVKFSVKGIKETINQPHKYIVEKNLTLFDIEEILQNAVFIKSMVDEKTPANNLFHYFEIQIKGENSYLIVKETQHDKKKTLYAIVDAIKKGS